MQFRFTRMVVLVAGLAVATSVTSACGKYSLSSIRSLKAFKDGAMLYTKGDYPAAAAKFEESVAQNPDFGFSYFYLGNSYDNMYRPGRRGEEANDALLPKAAQNYRLAIDKLTGSTEPQGAQILKLSYEYLIAVYGKDKLDDFSQAEPVAKELITYEPNEPGNYQLLARLYEEQGDYEQAEAMFLRAIEVNPSAPLGHQLLAHYYNRQGEFDKTMAAFLKRAELEPNNPEAWHTMGTYYYEKVYRDTSISRDQAAQYLLAGIQAEDKALGINPDYFEAVTFKSLLLALQANRERNPAEQKRLLAEASELRERALELQNKQGSTVPAAN
jgi:tetratricopeptide (TPR) repeat protein